MSILVLNYHGIGDVVMSLPLLDSLHKGFPREPIDVVVKSSIESDVVMTTGVRRTILFHREQMGLGKGIALVARLIGRYRLIVSTVNTHPLLAAWLGRLVLARSHIECEEELRSAGKATRGLRHKVDANLGIARQLKLPLVDRTPFLRIPRKERPVLTEETRRYVVVIHLATGTLVGSKRFDRSIAHYKELSTEFWVRLITETESLLGPVTWLNVGGDREKTLLEVVREHISAETDLRDFSGKLSILETAALIQRSHLFIGADSGLSHVAAAVRTPVIAFFGPTDSEVTGPMGENVTHLRTNACSLAPCFPSRIYDCRWPERDALQLGPDVRMCMNNFVIQSVVAEVANKLRSTQRIANTTA